MGAARTGSPPARAPLAACATSPRVPGVHSPANLRKESDVNERQAPTGNGLGDLEPGTRQRAQLRTRLADVAWTALCVVLALWAVERRGPRAGRDGVGVLRRGLGAARRGAGPAGGGGAAQDLAVTGRGSRAGGQRGEYGPEDRPGQPGSPLGARAGEGVGPGSGPLGAGGDAHRVRGRAGAGRGPPPAAPGPRPRSPSSRR